MLKQLDSSTFYAKWRKIVREGLPGFTARFQARIGEIGYLGIAVTSLALLAGNVDLSAGFIAGIAGNFVANEVERWRSTKDDTERDALLQQMAVDLETLRNNPEIQAMFRRLDLIVAGIDELHDKVEVLTNLVNSGFATQEQVNLFIYNTVPHYTRDLLHQINPIPPTFTGRASEIETIVQQIRDRANNQNAQVICIEGMPGVGKTELANYVALILAQDFPDAQLYIRLGAHSSNPLTPGEALAKCIRSFSHDPNVMLPEDEQTLHDIYLSLLNGKKALVVLDDARDDDHIRQLIPVAGCATIVTTRNALETGTILNLDTFSPAESRDLLTKVCKRLSDSQAYSLASLCGNLPIALMASSGYLKTRRSAPIDQYIESLRGPDRLTRLKVEDIFNYSYRSLSPELQQALHALSIMPAAFTRDAAVNVIGDSHTKYPGEDLDELVALNLIQYDEVVSPLNWPYRWHDLLRHFVCAHTTSEERLVYDRRHAIYFNVVLASLNAMYKDENQLKALAIFDLEWPHIRTGHNWSEKHASTDDEAARLSSNYANWPYIIGVRFSPSAQAQWLQTALSAAQRLHERQMEGIHRGNLGLALKEKGDYDEALEQTKQALSIAQELDDKGNEAVWIGNLGVCYAALHDFDRAIALYKEALALNRQSGNKLLEAQNLNNMGRAYARKGNLSRAVTCYRSAMDIHHANRYLHDEIITRSNLARIFIIIGRPYPSLELCSVGLDIAEKLGDRRSKGILLSTLASAHVVLGNTELALNLGEQALSILRQFGDHLEETHTLGYMGNAYDRANDTERALYYYHLQLEIASGYHIRHEEASALNNIANLTEDKHNATILYRAALAIYGELHNQGDEARVLRNLGLVYMEIDEYDHALEAFQLSAGKAEAIEQATDAADAYSDMSVAYERRGELMNALRAAEHALTICASNELDYADRAQSRVVELKLKLDQQSHSTP